MTTGTSMNGEVEFNYYNRSEISLFEYMWQPTPGVNVTTSLNCLDCW